MSAAEVIEIIKKLPPDELAEVEEFVRSKVTSPDAEKKVHFATAADFDRAKKRVFAENKELLRRLAQ